MSSDILGQPGAVAAPDGHPEAGVPWHFGDPFAEQRAATTAAVVVDRSHREVIAVTGSERLSWLHLMLSQHVTELADGAGTEALVLDSQGRSEAHMGVAHRDGTVWLDTDPGAEATSAMPKGGRQSLLEYLDSMRFFSDVTVSDATADRAVLTVQGPQAQTVLAAAGIPVDDASHAVGGNDDVIAHRWPWPDPVTVDLLVPRDRLLDWWQELTAAGARPAGSWAYDALRVAAQRPRLGVDTDERAIPHEVGWVDRAAHVAKGCYRGQETVAKVFNVGRPPRVLVLLHLDGSPEITPATGDAVRSGDRVVGRVGTVAQHHELGPIALALVKRSVSPDTELLAGDDDRAVQASIDPDSVPQESTGPGRDAVARLKGSA